MRRNPVIADLFHRMKYMERRGNGLRKIVSETEKLPGYTESYKPEFSSTATDFRVILKNVNYHHDYSIMDINQVKTCKFRFIGSLIPLATDQRFRS